MDSTTAQNNPQAGDNSYVEAYQPPPHPAQPRSDTTDQATDQVQAPNLPPAPLPPTPPSATQDQLEHADHGSTDAQAAQPAGSTSTSDSDSAQAPSITRAGNSDRGSDSSSEAIEDQNIFFLLGVTDGEGAQREAFLDELQQVIWEDFLEHDTQLLLTTDEHTQLQQLLENRESKDLEKQEEVIVFLEKLIPDLEEIMLEKALELKSDMVRERAQGLRQYFADKPEKISRIERAEQLMNEGSWYSAAHLLNSLNFS